MKPVDAIKSLADGDLKPSIPLEDVQQWKLRFTHSAQYSSQSQQRLLLLQTFVNFGNEHQVRRLLDKWSYAENIDHTWSQGDTVFIEASIRGRDQMISLLCEFGANINHATYDGWTALHYAAYYNRATVVQLLLEMKARTDLTTKEGYTPLDLAKRARHSAVVKLIQKKNEGNQAKTSGEPIAWGRKQRGEQGHSWINASGK